MEILTNQLFNRRALYNLLLQVLFLGDKLCLLGVY